MSLMSRVELQMDLTFHKTAKEKLQAAYLALAEGGVQQYSIGSRSLTKFDLAKIRQEIANHDKKIHELTAVLGGQKRRRAVGVVPRDW